MSDMILIAARTEAAVRALAVVRDAQIKGQVHRFDTLGSDLDGYPAGNSLNLVEIGYVALAKRN
jgi:hypothetical protein